MSFILDALKKSELERQRQSSPGLMDPGATVPRSRLPLWAAALGILLAVNLLVLSVVLLRRETASGLRPAAATASPGNPAVGAPAAGAVQGASAGAMTSAPAVPPAAAANVVPGRAAATGPVTAADSSEGHFSPMDGAPATYAPEIPLTEASAATDNSASRRSDPALRPAESAKSTTARADDPSDEVLPSVDQVNLTGAQALPDLHLDVHVYATSPGDRFVYINGRKYREGMRLSEGPIVERIRRDGVVLNAAGIRFLLPRQ
jgi:general secretion pathway protein B